MSSLCSTFFFNAVCVITWLMFIFFSFAKEGTISVLPTSICSWYLAQSRLGWGVIKACVEQINEVHAFKITWWEAIELSSQTSKNPKNKQQKILIGNMVIWLQYFCFGVYKQPADVQQSIWEWKLRKVSSSLLYRNSVYCCHFRLFHSYF